MPDVDKNQSENKAVMKKERDGVHPASHYLVVEDPEKPSTWHLRVRDVDGSLNHRLMGAAWAALHGGHRGQRYQGPNKQEAIDKLKKLYEREGLKPPPAKTIDGNVIDTAVKILHEDDDTVIVGGYGIVWGGRDLVGETFVKDTDLELDVIPQKPVFYDHTLTGIKHRLGLTITETPDDYGVWVEAQLERYKEYVAQVVELVKRGALGWSSGAVAHLVDRQGNVIKRWPVYEYSLTPTPAEPRTLGVEVIKSMALSEPIFEAFLPKASGEDAADVLEYEDIAAKHTESTEHNENEVDIMTEEVKNTNTEQEPAEEPAVKQAPEVDIGKIVEALKPVIENVASTAANDAVKQVLAKEPVDNGGYYIPEGEDNVTATKNAPAVSKFGFGDSEMKALAAWVRYGDGGTWADGVKLVGDRITLGTKASNDTSLNITTAADGGYLVPTGHFNNIIARRDEMLLAKKLGVRFIPGRGTTVNVPIDSEADGEFVATSEQNDAHTNNFDRDAPALGQKAFTLAKYSKKIELTDELIQDEDSRLMAFLEDFIARGMAKTHNNLLLTEVATNGTAFKTFASASAIAAGEPQDIIADDDLAAYLDDDRGVAWVMRSSTYWTIAKLTGNPFLYAPTPQGQAKELLGYPVIYSNKAASIAASAKSVYFGNWYYVGYRESPELTLLRDPYTVDGMLVLKYYFRTVYGVLQAEAIGYGVHPTA